MLTSTLVSCLALATSTAAVDLEPADIVVVNAKVWTADPDQPWAESFVVRDGRFSSVGVRPDPVRDIGPNTLVVDAKGALITPGLIDSHVHLQGAASDMRHLDLRPATSRANLLEMLGAYASQFAADAWVVGTRWSAESWPDQRPPTADEIDEATEGRKAILIRMDGHSLLASRSALDYANITKEGPPDPPGGAIGRNAEGHPTGQIYEQAQGLVSRHMRLPPVDMRLLLKRAITHANANGITQVGSIESISTIKELASLDEAGELTLRVSATVSGGGDDVESWTPALKWALENRTLSDKVSVLGFKGYMDGTLGSRTAWMMEPYEDNHMADDKAEDNVGFPLAMAGSGALPDLITLGSGMELQAAVHAIGDRSNHMLLNWYETVPARLREALRPRIEHAQHLLPEDVARFGELGVIPSMQPYHKADDGRYAEQRLGPERIKSSYAFRDLLDTGANLTFGSDWPVVSVNPFLGIHAAVTAATLDGKTFVPEQSITVEEALLCYTRNAAFALHTEDSTGRIALGFDANFVRLDRNLFEIDPAAISDTQVTWTVVSGHTAFWGTNN